MLRLCYTLFVFILLLPLTKGTVQCGVADSNPGAEWIVGGYRTEKHEWPWMVSMYDTDVQGHYCGATIISPKWVLSAAHCVYYNGVKEPAYIKKIIVSEYDTLTDENHDYLVNVTRIKTRRDYDDDTLAHDIALLELEEEIVYTKRAVPICIPRKYIGTGKNCTVVGWGETQGTGNDRYSREAILPTIANKRCSRQLGETISARQMCAIRPEGGIDTCQGDSGGPLMCQVNGKWFQHGITSWGYGCGEIGSPGVYTRVSRYHRWIRAITGGE